MVGLSTLLGGLRQRGASAIAILLVAVVASAAAAIGPIYYSAAQTSILRDSFASAPVIERGIEVTQHGLVAGQLAPLSKTVAGLISSGLPDPSIRSRVFATPIDAIESTAFFQDLNENPVLAWRTDVCAHLQIATGQCTLGTDDVVVSASLATRNGWKVGQRLVTPGWPTLTVTGIYAPPDFTADYWFGRGESYFPAEVQPVNAKARDNDPSDAMFTGRDTLDKAGADQQGTVVVDQLVNDSGVQGSDLPRLVSLVHSMTNELSQNPNQPAIATQLPAIVTSVDASQQSLSVPIFLITIQLLIQVWLLMFLVVRDAIDARGPEIALMRLRGRRGARLLGFALSEPLALLVVALPLGVLAAEFACSRFGHIQLRPGTPVGITGLAWAAAAAATLGGLLASVAGGWRTLRRSIVDQWEHTGRDAARRRWVLDAIVLTAAVAGLVELIVSGQVTSVKQGSLGLLVPGLFGLAIAVVGSRLLPAGCRALFGPTRRGGGLGPFLAVRHVARSSNGVRTTIVLAMAFALAFFAVAAWSIGRSNRAFVAEVGVGAPTVLSAVAPTGTDLGPIVDRIDPSGDRAAVVDRFVDEASSSGQVVLAVDPQRFAQVAAWRGDFTSQPLATLANQLAPSAAPSIPLVGDQFRIHLVVSNLSSDGVVLGAQLASPLADGPLNADLGALQNGTQTLTGQLAGCPCTLNNLAIAAAVAGTGGGFSGDITGSMTIEGIDEHGPSGWTALPARTLQAAQWRVDAGAPGLTQTADGLRWRFDFSNVTTGTLSVADRPDPLPAIVNRAATGTGDLQNLQINGLDDNALTVKAIAVASTLPGATGGAVIVDRAYAERAASNVLSGLVTQQVWVAAGSAGAIEAGLQQAGVRITQVQTAAQQTRLYNGEGPGLASLAFVADAVAALVLAGFGAVMGLVLAARRRRFEYAALQAAGASRRTLYVGLLLEQVTVLVFGAVAGIVAGVVAAVAAVRSIPEFVTAPALPLSYSLPGGTLLIWLGPAVLALVITAAVASRILLAGIGADQLREAQQ